MLLRNFLPVLTYLKPLELCKRLGKHARRKIIICSLNISWPDVAIRKWNSLVAILASSIFDERELNVDALIHRTYTIITGTHLISASDTVFTGEVQVKEFDFIEISSRSVTHESRERAIPDLSTTIPDSGLRRTRELKSHARLTPHLPFIDAARSCIACTYACVSANRSAKRDTRWRSVRGRGPTIGHIRGSPTLSRLTTVMGVNGHDVSRHALEIVKAETPRRAIITSSLARRERVSRTSELPDMQAEPRR